jgi:hypothetical protein
MFTLNSELYLNRFLSTVVFHEYLTLGTLGPTLEYDHCPGRLLYWYGRCYYRNMRVIY